MRIPQRLAFWAVFTLVVLAAGGLRAAGPADAPEGGLPRDLRSYEDAHMEGIAARLVHRARAEPFNVAATFLFFAAIVHTFLSSRFLGLSHKWEQAHERRIRAGEAPPHSVHHGAELFHFLGEVEAVFGIWAIALVAAIVAWFDWATAVDYISHRVNFTEALFVVVIMTLASTRPILKVSEAVMSGIAGLLGGTLPVWWLTILTLGPILGSFITEPAAMTICALLLSEQFYVLEPTNRLKYATVGLLFVNVSVGGTLTHFAAPPVLMVASPWEWDTAYMFTHFGWKAVLGILLANACYYVVFRRELARLQDPFQVRQLKRRILATHLERDVVEAELDRILDTIDADRGYRTSVRRQIDAVVEESRKRLEARFLENAPDLGVAPEVARRAFARRFEDIKVRRMRRTVPAWLPAEKRATFRDPDWDRREDPVPVWVTVVHILFMGWTIFNAHHPELFVPGLLFFLGFAQVTAPYQNRIDLKPALLVGFFLGGLVVHGGLQGWWIEPVLGSLSEIPLMLSATVLTAFNDNAAITFLATLVPDFSISMKQAVVVGAVAGGGLTVIANAPNPAGQSILKPHFENGVSPAGLLAAALVPTVAVWVLYLVLP